MHRNVTEKLGLRELIAMGVGGMIGGGIFSVLGIAVSLSGHAAPLSFVIDMLIALAAGYHYVRLALTFRDDGASYTYLLRGWPEQPWIAGIEGWTVIMGYIGTLALYAFTFGAYGADLLGSAGNETVRIWLSLSVLLFFMFVNLEGVKSAGVTEDLIVYTKIAILGLFAIIGLARVQPGRFLPLFDQGTGGLFLGAAVIFVAYEGFQLITNAVAETENPDRDVPRGIYGSILITGLIYLLLAVVAVGTMSMDQIVQAKEYALAEVARPLLGNAGRVLIGLAALMATSSAINSTLFGASRMMAEMGSRGMMPREFDLRDRRGVPWLAVVVMTVLAGVFTLLGSLSVIAEFSSMTFLLVSIGVSLANIKLRARTGANLWVALLGLALMLATVLAIAAYLAVHNPKELTIILGLYVVIGVLAALYNRIYGRPYA
ncbi:APC family permease [Oceanithermus desulfurans]|uniref:Amino acid transporter n=2 Tax=Oceanithermus desulfurans TaxID=227924 RepID=A0A511RP06_9DEIN|nr:APC family permease [Oceanithermus desulfurans]MBB6029916.1 amino acid transporter [Oceanithermus desulfurans]GEM90662.1 amino acid transporter [Oceanithermus desulfurans NBRC 100063]